MCLFLSVKIKKSNSNENFAYTPGLGRATRIIRLQDDVFKGLITFDFLQQAHPGTQVEVIDMFSYYHSLTSLWKQVDVIANVTKPFFANAKNGAHIIGFSQGVIYFHTEKRTSLFSTFKCL